jgi:hypothetical protein
MVLNISRGVTSRLSSPILSFAFVTASPASSESSAVPPLDDADSNDPNDEEEPKERRSLEPNLRWRILLKKSDPEVALEGLTEGDSGLTPSTVPEKDPEVEGFLAEGDSAGLLLSFDMVEAKEETTQR